MRKHEEKQDVVREVTIQISVDSRQITQARKRFNYDPNRDNMTIIREWAAKENLAFSSWI